MPVIFRPLKADEIEVRIGTINEKGCTLLLYKDARADMMILDETVGAENWQRRHTRDNANCIVSIWCGDKKQWVEKEDTGTESNTEKEKGLASDSFKRACTNWGIGRELYTSPFIWVPAKSFDLRKNEKTGKFATFDKFTVTEIEYTDKKISALKIVNSRTGEIVFNYWRPIVCPKCGKPVKGVKRADGSSASPEEVLSGCDGMCYDCYKANK